MVEHVSKEDLKFAYEQSIKAYQSHVQRYNTWMNMYAIMTGALFVAFYSIYGDEGKGMQDEAGKVLIILISVLGFICSLCWLGAVKGHYEWMKSFMLILKCNEKRFFGLNNPNAPFVYSKIIACKDICPKSRNYLYGFFSTQKITLLFISFVVLAWFFATAFLILNFFKIIVALAFWIAIILMIIFGVLVCKNWRKLECKKNEYIHSTIQLEEVIKTIKY